MYRELHPFLNPQIYRDGAWWILEYMQHNHEIVQVYLVSQPAALRALKALYGRGMVAR
jgi:uncharacterized protein YpiB (UPF0302 family)